MIDNTSACVCNEDHEWFSEATENTQAGLLPHDWAYYGPHDAFLALFISCVLWSDGMCDGPMGPSTE